MCREREWVCVCREIEEECEGVCRETEVGSVCVYVLVLT